MASTVQVEMGPTHDQSVGEGARCEASPQVVGDVHGHFCQTDMFGREKHATGSDIHLFGRQQRLKAGLSRL